MVSLHRNFNLIDEKRMKRYLKIALIVALLGLIGGGVVSYLLYNKPHRNIEKSNVDFMLTSTELLAAFELNPQESEKKFNGKVVLVSGKIGSVGDSDGGINAILSVDNGFFGVNCSFTKDAALPVDQTKTDSIIKVKGECKGYIDDVILVNCSIVE
jgi:hypothetical protein